MTRTTPAARRIVLVTALLVTITITAVALTHPTLQASSHPAPSPPALMGPAYRSTSPDPTVFGGGRAVTELDPRLLSALRRAATDAAHDTVRVRVNSGWRSTAEQQRLFRAAVQTHGSAAEAARWVARPGTSPHEAGDAVDIGPTRAVQWLARHGDSYGLCQIYRNEPWHYELRPTAVTQGCPTPYADPTHDPRLRR